MGIRSLLRNAFGRSKATREETGAAPSGAAKPESATIPEAREESTPAPATPAPEAEVPAARTAPTESPATDPAPATPTLPAQGTRPDVAERAAETSAAREESAVRDEARDRAEVRDEPAAEALATAEPAVAEPVEAADASSDSSSDTVSDLVSQAFDNPAPAAAAAEPTAETADTAAPTAEAEAVEVEVEPVAVAAEPEPVAAAAEPEPTSAPETKSATEPETEPAATAVAEPEPEPAAKAEAAPAPAPAPAPEAKPEPEAKPTPAAAAATDPKAADTTAPTTPPALDSLVKSAAAVLDKHGLATQRAVVYLVLDRSGSMRNYYKDGTVQNLAEQALGLSARLDEAATVPVIFFSTDIDGTADLDLTHYEGRIAELHAGLGHMGRTNYHWAINAVVEHYKKSGSTAPAFVIFQTDGAPTSKPAAEKALCEAAGLPIFWQFLGFGDPDAKGFDFLRKLDDLTVPERRAVDNAGFFHAGRDPRSLSHDELYQQLMVEFPEWLAEARSAGILKDS
ncbi:VWA domain-containing protein [Streptomyces sp. ISID311]|uniref:vWA domain-containing protein n=1 Tax=Streptomyces sp. ISID311 TaxID=2601673 RepID=UPI0011BD3CBA|nr:VWA domain-containing protein [Streptomyces sp. ISID311]TXC97921.1 VWA domain-containing protein [Streptomyces sp. ISID311]